MLFLFASVSKSLLIVLGTLLIVSLPAKNDREKRHADMHFSPSVFFNICLPAMLIYLRACARRGTCGIKPHLPLVCSSGLHSSMMSHRLWGCSLATTQPIVPFGGLPLSRLMALHPCLQG